MRGRPPKPDRLKKLSGTYRKDRKKTPPKFEVGEPEMPDGLDELAREEWERVVPVLVESGVLMQVDRAVLTGYVMAWSEWMRMEGDIQANGLYQTTDSGYQQVRPTVTARDKARKACHGFASELGFTPPSRQRLDIQPTKKDDEVNPFSLLHLAK